MVLSSLMWPSLVEPQQGVVGILGDKLHHAALWRYCRNRGVDGAGITAAWSHSVRGALDLRLPEAYSASQSTCRSTLTTRPSRPISGRGGGVKDRGGGGAAATAGG